MRKTEPKRKYTGERNGHGSIYDGCAEATDEGQKRLAPDDLENLRASGLTSETIRNNRLRTDRRPEGSRLVFPYRGLDGREDGFCRWRLSNPGGGPKYKQREDTPVRAYFPSEALNGLNDGTAPVWITEGEKKALALGQLSYAAIGIGGIWCGTAKTEAGGFVLIPDLRKVPWEGRNVYVVFDYDTKETTRREAELAKARLAKCLREAGAAEVYDVVLPPGPDGGKQGVDDYLVAMGEDCPEALGQLADDARPVGDKVNSINSFRERKETGDAYTGTPPVLGEDAYLGPVGEFLRAVAPYTEATDAGVLAHLLPAVGTLIGPGPHVYAGENQPPKINTVLVGQTNTGRKGTSAVPVNTLMALVDEEFWKRQKVSGLSSGEGLIAYVADKKKTGEDGEEEIIPTEKRLYVIEQEFSCVLLQAKREGNILSETIRQAFDGSGDLGNLTKGNPIQATGTHISIVGHITPEELKGRLSETAQLNGFGNRFLWFYVKSDKVIPETRRIPDKPFLSFAPRLRALADAPARCVEMDGAAAEMWREELYPALRVDRPGLAGAMTARGSAIVLRVALLYSLIEKSKNLRPEHLRAAMAVWRYGEESAYLLFRTATGSALGDKLLALLRANGPMKKNQFTDHLAKTGGDIEAELLKLLAAGRVTRTKEKRTGPGRPAEVWALAGGN